jgi:hypothetical protein
MSDEQEVAIRIRESWASPGPWRVRLYSAWAHGADIRDAHNAGVVCCGSPNSNADFVAHARTDIPYLLGLLDAERASSSAAVALLRQTAALLRKAQQAQGGYGGRGGSYISEAHTDIADYLAALDAKETPNNG